MTQKPCRRLTPGRDHYLFHEFSKPGGPKEVAEIMFALEIHCHIEHICITVKICLDRQGRLQPRCQPRLSALPSSHSFPLQQ